MKTFFLLLSVIAAHSLFSSDSTRYYATNRVTSNPPTIDGLGDDESWSLVPWAGDFVQRLPTYGEEPSEQTQFKILYDAKNLYVLIRAFDSEPEKIVERMSRRDGFEGDWVEINIDSYNDKRTAFSFTASVSGVKGDEYISNNGDNWDSTWDPIWYLATSIDAEGWMAEYRIPLSQLRFADQPEHTWGIQVNRRFFRNDEMSTFQPIAQDAPGWVHLFAELRGIKGIKPQKQLEIQPYLLAGRQRYSAEEGNPFADGKDGNFDAGLDAKIGLTSDITLDLTLNPDFGQVEADPSQVNLTAFRLFFRERRPFFLEGNNIMNFPIVGFNEDNLFYSRQIGGSPSYFPSEFDYVDRPNQTRILGAAKLTGKNRNGFSWAFLESLTNSEKARVSLEGQEDEVVVEPLTNYMVGRVQQDINEGNTVIGAMLTHTKRFIKDDHLDFLHQEAISGGVDLQHNFKDRKYRLNFRSVFSSVSGSEESITLTQNASERFFQRPDNNYKSVDTTLTSLSGSGGTISFGKNTGNLIWEIGTMYRSPGLELNDVGFLAQTDNITEWFFSQYRILEPIGIFRFMRMNFIQWREYDFGYQNLSTGYELFYGTQFKNFWNFNTGYTLTGSNVSNADLRGGPSIKYPGGSNWFYGIGTNSQKKLALFWNQRYFWGFEDFSYNSSVNLSVTYRPLDALELSLSPSLSKNRNDLQYISTIEENDQNTFLLGRVQQEIYRMTIRANYNLTPNLTFEFWGQPFLASGRYSDFKLASDQPAHNEYDQRFLQFEDERVTFDIEEGRYRIDDAQGQEVFGFSNPNFNIREFRSNLVMRWEYVPGSILFLVWSSNGSAFDQEDRQGFQQVSEDLFQLKSRNSFLIKYTYRFIL